MELDQDTIVATITAAGPAAVSLVRISGSQTKEILKRLSPKHEKVLRSPRSLVYSPIYQALPESSGELIDCCLLAYFKAPESFTGEDCLELNLHGSSYVIERVLENILHLGVRLANPGEFSQRAFLNGRMDLCQAEAISDLIASETASQAKLALEQLEGRLSNAVSELGNPLRELLAEIEAHIDFPEEGIGEAVLANWRTKLNEISQAIQGYLDSFEFGRICREGASLALVGLPNAGKSSLLNYLVGEKRAIVTDIPGTTRDFIEETISLDGLCVRLWDTAGFTLEGSLKHQPDQVEEIGIEISKKKLAQAEVVFYVFDASIPLREQQPSIDSLIASNRSFLLVANKIDLLTEAEQQELYSSIAAAGYQEFLAISAKDGSGIKELRSAISRLLLAKGKNNPQASVIISNKRHQAALKSSNEGISRAAKGIQKEIPLELIALELRESLSSLNDIVGVTESEDILGLIFSKFCIGK